MYLNELFFLLCFAFSRSLHCFELSWPWRKSSPFFLKPKPRTKVHNFTLLLFALIMCFFFPLILQYDQFSLRGTLFVLPINCVCLRFLISGFFVFPAHRLADASLAKNAIVYLFEEMLMLILSACFSISALTNSAGSLWNLVPFLWSTDSLLP